MTARPRSSPPFPFAARHACGCTGPDGPPRCRQLSSRTSSLVHRPQPRCATSGVSPPSLAADADMADALTPQDGLYTLITRSAEGDTFELIGALSAVHAAADHEAYLDYLSRPEVAIVTITVTEAGYLRGADGHLDAGRDVIVSDLEALRSDPRNPVASLPARLVAGLVARRASGASALTILSCDNLPENGAVTRTVVQDFAALLDETLGDWIDSQVDFATSMVDRITPRTTDEDRALVQQACGYVDAYPVATEPFSEWVISGGFPAGRPRWEEAGATIVAEVGTLRAAQALAAQRVTLDARLRRQHPGILDDR